MGKRPRAPDGDAVRASCDLRRDKKRLRDDLRLSRETWLGAHANSLDSVTQLIARTHEQIRQSRIVLEESRVLLAKRHRSCG